MNSSVADLLYRSFDSELTPDEAAELQSALATSQELRDEQRRLQEMRKLLTKAPKPAFRPFFSARVMNRLKAELDEREDWVASLLWSFRWIGAAAALAVVLLFTKNALEAGGASFDDILAMPKLTLEDTFELEVFQPEAL